MVVVEPLLLGLAASGALARLPQFGVPAYLLLAARGGVAALGIVIGRRLWNGEAEARRPAMVWASLACAMALLTIATPYFPGNRTPDGKRLAVLGAILWYGWWIVYLFRLRVRGAPARTAARTTTRP